MGSDVVAYKVLLAAHEAADELDEWDGGPSAVLGGCSPGGVVRHAVHEAFGVSMFECPACKELARRFLDSLKHGVESEHG